MHSMNLMKRVSILETFLVYCLYWLSLSQEKYLLSEIYIHSPVSEIQPSLISTPAGLFLVFP